jgi:hypothetical protein
MKPDPGPWGCELDHAPIAVKDTYTSASSKECFNITSNDYDSDPGDQFMIDPSFGNGGFLLLNGGNLTALNTGTQLCLIRDPDYCGTIRLQYRLKDRVTGRTGNITTIAINQTPPGGVCNYNPDEPCNYVMNGGFERGIPLDYFDNIRLYDNMHGLTPTDVDHWYGYSADLFIKGSLKTRNTSWPEQGIPVNFRTR